MSKTLSEIKDYLKDRFGPKQPVESERFREFIDAAINFEESDLSPGGLKLDNKHLHLTTDQNEIGQSDVIRIQNLTSEADGAIAFYDRNGNVTGKITANTLKAGNVIPQLMINYHATASNRENLSPCFILKGEVVSTSVDIKGYQGSKWIASFSGTYNLLNDTTYFTPNSDYKYFEYTRFEVSLKNGEKYVFYNPFQHEQSDFTEQNEKSINFIKNKPFETIGDSLIVSENGTLEVNTDTLLTVLEERLKGESGNA